MTKASPLISIIIPHWNGIETLSECINSLLKTDFDSYEIIIVDNASTDGSQEWIKLNHPEINLVENDSNYGYAGGCNRGAEIAKGDFLVFLNNDTIQEPDWLKYLLDCIQKDNTIAAVQPKILNYYEKTIFDYAGGAGGEMDIFCYPFARGRVFLQQEKDNQQYDNSSQCFWASGTAIMVKKDLFITAGKFDEIFFAHMEEIDLCWRLKAMGYQIWVEPKSIVFHKNALSLPMHTHRKYYLNHRNSLLMLFSNYPLKKIIYLGTIRIFLEFVALCYSMFKLDINHITGILHSLIWIVFHPQIIIKKRMHYKKINKSIDNEIFKCLLQKSIVVNYYVFGKKTYSSIVSKDA